MMRGDTSVAPGNWPIAWWQHREINLDFNEAVPPLDEELITATLAGDGAAFAVLVRRYRPPLLEMACRILGQREEAEDVLQEVFMSVHAHLNRFRGESKLSTWLYTIALNRVRNQIRRRGKRRIISLDIVPEEGTHRWELPEKGPPIEEVVAQQRDSEKLRSAVDALPPHFRAIFVLHYYQHVPLKEVAQQLEKPLGTVKVYLHRARKHLQATYFGGSLESPQ
ncbi:MAG: RNA polymerase sigma factor [Elusimicrobia bacterium]|jgi:RNA polymerase sigma-70 factor (ECF subfamily)|nr:RNA polymerase sigma factor [Elusimicrobiota bacterium]